MSSGSSVVSSLIGGIQDISALLPLLGTEQCEDCVSSALSRGYLYAAASPMSLFGSLGVARAGIKALIATISIPSWGISGAEKLNSAGFTAFENLSLILMDDEYPGRYRAETRLDDLLEEMQLDDILNVQNLQRLRLKMPTIQWNMKLFVSTTLLSCTGIAPYVLLNNHRDNNVLNAFNRWAFPLSRILGTFLTTTFLQIVIERRLITILRKRLIFHTLKNGYHAKSMNLPKWDDKTSSERTLSYLDEFLRRHSAKDDSENGLQKEDDHRIALQRERDDAFTHLPFGAFSIWDIVSYALLFLGLLGSIIGYLLSFSVVQHAENALGPLIWVILEGFLSIVRMVLWGWNPSADDSDAIVLSIVQDSHSLFPTSGKSVELIHRSQMLPLITPSKFMRSFRIFIGISTSLAYEGTSIYYALARKSSSGPDIQQWRLYISVFDHRSLKKCIYWREDDVTARLITAEYLDNDHSIDEYGIVVSLARSISPENFPLFNASSGEEKYQLLQDHYSSIWFALFKAQGTVWAEDFSMGWDLYLDNTHGVLRPLQSEPSDKPKERKPRHNEREVSLYLQLGDLEEQQRQRIRDRSTSTSQCANHLQNVLQSSLNDHEYYDQSTDELSTCVLMISWFEAELIFLHNSLLWDDVISEKCQEMLRGIRSRGNSTDQQLLRRWELKDWTPAAMRSWSHSYKIATQRISRAEDELVSRFHDPDSSLGQDLLRYLFTNLREQVDSQYQKYENGSSNQSLPQVLLLKEPLHNPLHNLKPTTDSGLQHIHDKFESLWPFLRDKFEGQIQIELLKIEQAITTFK